MQTHRHGKAPSYTREFGDSARSGGVKRLETRAIDALQYIRGIAVPDDVRFRQIIVTGPPASGKTTLVTKLGGWPEEGYLDLAEEWWRQRLLSFRPREVHFGFPAIGWKYSLAVFDSEWLEGPVDVDTVRIRLPPSKRGLFSIDWRRRYAFDFQLPPPAQVYTVSKSRARAGTHPHDQHLTPEQVASQHNAYVVLALFFKRHGLRVYVRESFQGEPRCIIDTGAADTAATA